MRNLCFQKNERTQKTFDEKQVHIGDEKNGRRKLLFMLALLGSINILMAQERGFVEAIQSGLAALDTAKSSEQMNAIAIQFERISSAEPNEWLAAYYASFVYTLMSYSEQDGNKKDLLLDKAEAFLKESMERKPEESENYVLQAFQYLGRIQVNPMERGMQYSMQAQTSLEKAIGLNPDNPRSYYMKGVSLYYTPQEFGGGKEVAMPLLTKAREKYEQFQSPNPVWPSWGKDHLLQLMQ